MEKYFFENRTFDWGWTPAIIEGWLIMVFYLFLTVKTFIKIDSQSHSGSDTPTGFVVPFIFIHRFLS